MWQVTIYLDDSIEEKMRKAAKDSNMSQSKWISKIIKGKNIRWLTWICQKTCRRLERFTYCRRNQKKCRKRQKKREAMIYILDTNTLIYYSKGIGKVADGLLSKFSKEIGIPSIVLYELEVDIAKSVSLKKKNKTA